MSLQLAVNVPVAVNTVWAGPDGFMPAQAAIGSTTTFTSTATVSSFGRNQSGVYNCTATVSSTSSFIRSVSQSGTARVTVGKSL